MTDPELTSPNTAWLHHGNLLNPAVRRDIADLNRLFLAHALDPGHGADCWFQLPAATVKQLTEVAPEARERAARSPISLFELALPRDDEAPPWRLESVADTGAEFVDRARGGAPRNRHRRDRPRAAHFHRTSVTRVPSPTALVMSNSLAHHLPEPLDLLREIARVVKPGGAILVRDLLRPESVDAARAIVDRVAASDTPRQRQLFFDSLCAALTLDEVRERVAAAGIEGAAVTQVSDRHWSVERARSDR